MPKIKQQDYFERNHGLRFIEGWGSGVEVWETGVGSDDLYKLSLARVERFERRDDWNYLSGSKFVTDLDGILTMTNIFPQPMR